MNENLGDSSTSTPEAATKKWTDWAAANYPPELAPRVSAAAIEAVRSGAGHEAVYAAALEAAVAPVEPEMRNEAATLGDVKQPLVVELVHAKGLIGLSADGGELVVRTHGRNPLTRKEWQKDEAKGLAVISRILVVSRDRVTYGFGVYDQEDKPLLHIQGCSAKEGLDIMMQAITERAPHIRIELAHPSHGVPDPLPDEVKGQRKRAEAFNREENNARANSLRQVIKVKNYDNGKDYARDANSMARAGWTPQGETAGRGKVSVGGTAGKLILTGGLGAITGMSHKGSKMTVTWIKQLPYHEPREFMAVPTVPEARSFPAEPYFTATNLARVEPGDEYPIEGATVTLSCFKCHSDVTVPALATDYRCAECGEHFYMRACPNCPKTVLIGSALQGKSIKCVSCQYTAPWKRWDARQVSADRAPGLKTPTNGGADERLGQGTTSPPARGLEEGPIAATVPAGRASGRPG